MKRQRRRSSRSGVDSGNQLRFAEKVFDMRSGASAVEEQPRLRTLQHHSCELLNLACSNAAESKNKRKTFPAPRIATSVLLSAEMDIYPEENTVAEGKRLLQPSAVPFAGLNLVHRKQQDGIQPRQNRKPHPPLFLCVLLLLLPSGARGQNDGNTTTMAPESPTVSPTAINVPTLFPSVTVKPSPAPSMEVTTFSSRGLYRQDFWVPPNPDSEELVALFYNETQQAILGDLFASYTNNLVNQTAAQVQSICIIDTQVGSVRPEDNTNNATINTIDYTCNWESRVEPIDFLPELFLDYITANLDTVLKNDMIAVGLPLIQPYAPSLRTISTPSPTLSKAPSVSPTGSPTISDPPSTSPSLMPSLAPSGPPQSTDPPFVPPPQPSDEPLSAGAISAIVIFVGLAFIAGLIFYYLNWKRKRTTSTAQSAYTGASVAGNSRAGTSLLRPGHIFTNGGGSEADEGSDENVVISPTDSLLSNKSMLSAGDSGLGDESDDEMDNTKNLQDEFDQYKDQNLELLRQNVEGNLSGFEGIMSAAVTNALMGDEEANVETQELLWGCSPNPQGEEIEASALFEVSDWLQRNESATAERKRAFMQEILNRMVRSVRFGVLNAGDASRTIHESAAILGLKLAEELPMTTVIISGMRKTTTADDMKKALKEFGDIDVAAVASGRRGFGIVRFRRNRSVDRALKRYRSGEIVILDVSIQLKVLMPSGSVDSR